MSAKRISQLGHKRVQPEEEGKERGIDYEYQRRYVDVKDPSAKDVEEEVEDAEREEAPRRRR